MRSTPAPTKALADHGFGVLTEIDAKAMMKKKLNVEMYPYLILGACNPQMAHQAIGMVPRVRVMLPCNVILREIEDGVEAAYHPLFLHHRGPPVESITWLQTNCVSQLMVESDPMWVPSSQAAGLCIAPSRRSVPGTAT